MVVEAPAASRRLRAEPCNSLRVVITDPKGRSPGGLKSGDAVVAVDAQNSGSSAARRDPPVAEGRAGDPHRESGDRLFEVVVPRSFLVTHARRRLVPRGAR